MPKKLKVFRTPIGFHDAYVAAPSQKAALQAWGSHANLFARGSAEEVIDPTLMKEPLSRPGEVIKRSRGSVAEQIAALPADKPSAGKHRERSAREPAPTRPPKPRPDRSALDAAEKKVADAEASQRAELKAFEEREAELANARRDIERAHETELRRLKQEEDRTRESYQRAMAKWRG